MVKLQPFYFIEKGQCILHFTRAISIEWCCVPAEVTMLKANKNQNPSPGLLLACKFDRSFCVRGLRQWGCVLFLILAQPPGLYKSLFSPVATMRKDVGREGGRMEGHQRETAKQNVNRICEVTEIIK